MTHRQNSGVANPTQGLGHEAATPATAQGHAAKIHWGGCATKAEDAQGQIMTYNVLLL